MIKKESIDRLLALAKIEEVIGDVVSLKREGQNFVACCPFHNERTPSFKVNPSRNIFKCFGCDKGGGVVNFIMEYENLNYPEALRYLAKKYNFVLEEEAGKVRDVEKEQKSEALHIVLEFARDFFCQNAEKASITEEYWQARGFRQEIVQKFQIGYADMQRNSLVLALEQGKYNLALAEECGLIKKNGTVYVDAYVNRIIFPIWNSYGRVIAFAARSLGDALPKYINSPEHELYVKGQVLYALSLARRMVAKTGNCYVVEGYTDAMRLYEKGVENVVASSGTALTIEQVRLIKNIRAQKITILYDADRAGVQNALRVLNFGLQLGLDVYAIKWQNYAEKQDPDSFFHGCSKPEVEQFLVEHSLDFVDFRYQIAAENPNFHQDIAQKHQVLQEILADLTKYPESCRTKRTLYLQKISQLFGIEVRELEANLLELLPVQLSVPQDWQKSRPQNPPKIVSKSKIAPLIKSEENILRLLWQYPDEKWQGEFLRDYILQNYFDEFTCPVCVAMLELFQQEYQQRGIVPSSKLFLEHEKPEFRDLMTRLLAEIDFREENFEALGGGNDELARQRLLEKHQRDMRETFDVHTIRVLEKARKDNIMRMMNCTPDERLQLQAEFKLIDEEIERKRAEVAELME